MPGVFVPTAVIGGFFMPSRVLTNVTRECHADTMNRQENPRMLLFVVRGMPQGNRAFCILKGETHEGI